MILITLGILAGVALAVVDRKYGYGVVDRLVGYTGGL